MSFTENDVKLLAILRAATVVAKAEEQKNDALIKSLDVEIQGLISRMESKAIEIPDNISEKFDLETLLIP
jgi:hypothetical protein